MVDEWTRKKIYFLYENSGDTNDAVTLAMRQLAEGLSAEGFNCEILKKEKKRPSTSSKVWKMLSQFTYFADVLRILLSKTREQCIVVTLDAPSGLRLLTVWAAIISRGNIKHVPWLMDFYRFIDPPARLWSLSGTQRLVEQVALKRTQHAVVLGSCMAKVARHHFNIQPKIIPIWQDASKFVRPSSERLSNFRYRHSLDGKFVVLYSGTARLLHPLGDLVRAATLLQNNDNIAFLVIGRGNEVERTRTEVLSLGLSNFQVLDYLPIEAATLAAYSADVHVVALAERATGTCVPSKGYAAMAAGKPVLYIGASTGQLAKDIIHSDAGEVFREESAEEIVQYLLELAADSNRLYQQGHNARAYFEAHRTSTKGVEAWADHIRSLE